MSDDKAWPTAAMMPVTLRVNGRTVHTEAALHDTVLTVLRDRLQLTATKRGCNQGVCGACTILVDGQTMRACLCLSYEVAGADLQTLEGLNEARRMQALQAAFAAHGALQCGFCTPGMLVSASALLQGNAQPEEAAIRTALSGNLCRCTGYIPIVAAVQSAAAALRQEGES